MVGIIHNCGLVKLPYLLGVRLEMVNGIAVARYNSVTLFNSEHHTMQCVLAY